MKQAITTQYFGPTDHRPSRIKAKAYMGSTSLNYSNSKNADENHEAAAIELANKFNWLDNDYKLVGGYTHDGQGAFVLIKI